MTSCPPSAPAPPVSKLRARGVTVFAGSDNIRDCWSPYGNGDMLDRAAIIAERHALFTDGELEDAFALTTSEADKALGYPRRELRAGAVADLVVDLHGQPISFTISVGLAALQGGDLGGSMERADRALYQAKRQGRDRVVAAPGSSAC